MIDTKIVLVLFTLLFGENNSTQNISGEVIYSFAQNAVTKEEKDKSKELYGLLDKMNDAAKELNFSLKFNNKESLFYLNRTMDSDINPMGISYVNNVVSRGKYYYDKSKDIILRQESLYGNNTLVQSVSSELNNWKLINESKKIGEYECFKAIRTKTKIGGTKQKKFTVIAWYCPTLPVSFGPKEFNSLPGLILELVDTHYTFYANKVKIELDTSYTIKPLVSKNIITKEQHLKRIKESYSKQ